MARSLDKQIVSEGIEDEEQVAFLRKHQAYCAQGYYFSKPLLADDLIQYIKQHNDKGTKTAALG